MKETRHLPLIRPNSSPTSRSIIQSDTFVATFVQQIDKKEATATTGKKNTQLMLKQSTENKQKYNKTRLAESHQCENPGEYQTGQPVFFYRSRCWIHQTCDVPRAMLSHVQSQAFLGRALTRVVQGCLRRSKFLVLYAFGPLYGLRALPRLAC